MDPLTLSILPIPLAVCRLASTKGLPTWAIKGSFFSITRSEEELSIVCSESQVPPGTRVEGGWRGLKVEGPLDFALTGILAGIADVLAQAKISLFAISTYDTDYILVRQHTLEAAVTALRNAGYQIVH